MFAGCGSKCGADDEEDDAADAQRTAGDLPAVEKDGLCGQVAFQSDDLFLVFRNGIGSTGERPEGICSG